MVCSLIKTQASRLTCKAKPERRFELLPATFRALKWPLIATIFPRLCLISFQFSQPFLISQSLEFLSEPENASTKYKGYALIGVTFLIYFGIAVSSSHTKLAPLIDPDIYCSLSASSVSKYHDVPRSNGSIDL